MHRTFEVDGHEVVLSRAQGEVLLALAGDAPLVLEGTSRYRVDATRRAHERGLVRAAWSVVASRDARLFVVRTTSTLAGEDDVAFDERVVEAWHAPEWLVGEPPAELSRARTLSELDARLGAGLAPPLVRVASTASSTGPEPEPAIAWNAALERFEDAPFVRAAELALSLALDAMLARRAVSPVLSGEGPHWVGSTGEAGEPLPDLAPRFIVRGTRPLQGIGTGLMHMERLVGTTPSLERSLVVIEWRGRELPFDEVAPREATTLDVWLAPESAESALRTRSILRPDEHYFVGAFTVPSGAAGRSAR